MRVYLTGATGFIGSRILDKLVAAGHEVIGQTRSAPGAASIARRGGHPFEAVLEDPSAMARGAVEADAVIHTAFDHDFSTFEANCEKDRKVIEAIGAASSGRQVPIILTSGVGLGSPREGEAAIETYTNRYGPNPRIATEVAAKALLDQGRSVAIVRLPQVHDRTQAGLISPLIDIYRANGSVGIAKDGSSLWSAAHVDDVAELFLLALTHHRQGMKWHAVAEEGVAFDGIAKALSERLKLPLVQVPESERARFFGAMEQFIGQDMSASSAETRRLLGWEPSEPGLLEDLESSTG